MISTFPVSLVRRWLRLAVSVSSIRTYYSCLRRFLLWTEARGRTLAQLTGEDLDDYHREVVALRLSAGAIKRHRRAVRMLWAYRSGLTDYLEQDPLRRTAWQAWVRAHSRRPRENLTDRIPELVLGPLLTWALRWVDDFADDVLAARAERNDIDNRPPAGPDPSVG
ncbi:site-specific integrase [Streptomyces ardesiacus]|uniref:site-specific integrase n=1 Tax=Streptomyces ardesiacus TaxID=285564 RepID=UPI002FDBF62A